MTIVAGARSFCLVRLPRAGLGNKLLVWAKAFVFSRLNDIPLVVTGWVRPQRASVLHGGHFRLYLNYFQPVREVGIIERIHASLASQVVENPPVSAVALEHRPTVYRFSEIPHWSDYFRDLKPHRELVRSGLRAMLAEARERELASSARPTVSLQVRMTDYRQLKSGEDFRMVGNARTPIDYFLSLLRRIREVHGSTLPVTVFSDGSPGELRDLLSEPGVKKAPFRTAITDILLMAASNVLVPSAGSTFGYWGAFLGDNAVILHPDHIHESIRPDDSRHDWYEGPAVGAPGQWPELLVRNIRNIRSPAA